MALNLPFVTSDWHIGHDKSLIYDKRPFDNLEHMHRVLINNYNASVGPDSFCWFLGDIGWKDKLKEVFDKLNGNRGLVLGNHDTAGKEFYKSLGFSCIINANMITLGKDLITMSHCPLRGVFREGPINQDGEQMKNFRPFESWHGEARHDKYSLPDFGQYHLHGHTHKRKGNDVRTHNQWDIGVVGNDYRPVSFSSIEAWIATNKRGTK